MDRNPSFSYVCKCNERCFEKNVIMCVLNKQTRKYCRCCRFKKCEKSAGMVRKLVLQQYIPTVPKNNKNGVKNKAMSTRSFKESPNGANSSASRTQGDQVMKTMIFC